MKKTLAGATLAAAFALSGPASAMTVFADFDGDGVHDPLYVMSLVDTVSVDVYAQLTADEDAAGGLLSFATEGTLQPAGIANVTAASIESNPWAIGQEIQLDSDSVRALGGSLGLLAPKGLVKLFTVDLAAVSVGVTTLSFADWDKSATFDGNVLADGTVLDGTINYIPSDIQVVPIPAAAWLFGSALLGLAGIARRRKV